MEFKKDKGTGYMYCYNPYHPTANKAGKVLEHVYVITELIGRLLLSDECVHHKDRNRENNNINNLQLMTNSEHAKLHQYEDNNVFIIINICKKCNIEFETTNNNKRIYCSFECSRNDYRKFEIDKDELSKLVWEIPTSKISKIYGVSDKSIEKRCKLYKIDKPPRGYWSKNKGI